MKRLYIRHTELAAMTGMTTKEIKWAVRRGRIPGRIVSRRVVLHRVDEILRWLGVDSLPEGCGIIDYTRASRLWPNLPALEDREDTCQKGKEGGAAGAASESTSPAHSTSSSAFLTLPEEGGSGSA